MEKKYFDKNDTLIYKGLGILFIVIHNYLHWQPGFGIENEDKFSKKNFYTFTEYLSPFEWTNTISSISGFLGHYGVQIFIFFSAYGLTIQFINNKDKLNYFDYLFKRLKKLYFLLFFGIILYIIFYFMLNGKFYGTARTIKQTLLLSTSISNLRHSTLYAMFTGPFWFFGLMVQLYIIFPLLFKIVKKYNNYLVFFCSFLLIYTLYYFDLTTTFSLFGTIIGHLPEVLLGISLAINEKTKPSLLLFISCLILFVISQITTYIFPLSFLSMTIILIYTIEFIKKYLNSFWIEVLKYFGAISMSLFVVNGFFRLHPLFKIEDHSLRGERIFLYLVLLFIVTHYIHKIYIFISSKLRI